MAWSFGGQRWSLALLSLLVTFTLSVDAQAQATPAVERYQLPNGLRVVLAPDSVTAGVSVVVRYGLGSAHDPANYRGLSHLLEHLTFRGSRHLKPLQGMALLESLGAGFNGVTETESTSYLTQITSGGLETVLWLESERMGFALDGIDEAALAIEQRIVASELRLRGGSLRRLFARPWLSALYGEQHPFVPGEQELDDVRETPLSGVQWLYQTGYRPDNATLVLVGKFDARAARGAIDKYFAAIRSPALARTKLQAPPPRLCGVHRLGLAHSGLFGHYLRFAWPLPALASSRDHVLVAALAQLLERRLNRELGDKGSAAAILDVGIAEHGTHAVLTLNLELDDDASPVVIEQQVLRLAKGLASQPAGAAELRTVRANLSSHAVFQRADGLSRAMQLAAGRDPDAEARALSSLYANDVLQAARPLGGPVLIAHAWPDQDLRDPFRIERNQSACP